MRHFSRLVTSILPLAFILFSLPTGAYCDCRVTLQWDPNNPSPEGYRIYGREAGGSYNFDEPWWEGDQSFTQGTIDQLDENTTYYFVVRAFDAADNQSGDSNEVVFRYSGPSDSSSNLGDSSSTGGGGGGGCFLNALIIP
jgi:hypothetical protein